MDCKTARELIDTGREDEELSAHLRGCAQCRGERALWDLLGEAGEIEPGLEFTERVLAKVRQEERRSPWKHFRDLLGGGFTSTRTLDEFLDFPPESFGAVIFGSYRRAG